MDIKEALADLIKDVTQIDTQAISINSQLTNDEKLKCYYQGRHDVSHSVRIKLLELIKLLPTEQVTYYVLKETDNLNDILKGVKDGSRTEKDTNERSYQEQN